MKLSGKKIKIRRKKNLNYQEKNCHLLPSPCSSEGVPRDPRHFQALLPCSRDPGRSGSAEFLTPDAPAGVTKQGRDFPSPAPSSSPGSARSSQSCSPELSWMTFQSFLVFFPWICPGISGISEFLPHLFCSPAWESKLAWNILRAWESIENPNFQPEFPFFQSCNN